MDILHKPFLKRIAGAVGIGIGVFVIGSGAYYAGYARGTAQPETITVKGVTNIDDPDVTADFSLFWEAWDKLKQHHLRSSKVEDQDLLYGAVNGLAGSFGDEHTVYFPPADAQKFAEDIQGHFGGIGAEIGLKNKQLIIIAPLKTSPAERAGLASGDEILKIDDFDTVGIAVDDAVKRIRGQIGTTVVLGILRNGWVNPKDISITRDTIIVPTVDQELKREPDGTDGIMHIKLYNFNENAQGAFHEAVINAFLGGAKGMVLDLRNNPGGFLEVAVSLAGWFLNRGGIVTI